MSNSLYNLFRSRFPKNLDRLFISGPEVPANSYADLDLLSARLAHRLAASGAKQGDRIMVQVEKSPMAVLLYLACLRGGFVFLPLNPAYGADELRYLLEDAKPSVAVCDPRSPLCELAGGRGAGVLTLDAEGGGTLTVGLESVSADGPEPEIDGGDLATILYTSGTTGRPKGAMLSHENLASNALALHEAWGFRDGDVLLHALPIFHTHGLFVAINTTLLHGGSMLFLRRFQVDEVIRLLPSATVMMGVPTFYSRLLSAPDFDAVVCAQARLFVSGSAPLSVETFRAFQERTGHEILERYGMTETGMIASNPLEGARVAGAVGLPLRDVEIRISGNDGERLPANQVGSIEVRGPNVFKGYWGRAGGPTADFTTDGFFVTGDLGLLDARGYLHIVGRSKDLIITGGLNVYPKEVETVIERLGEVAETAVIGVPHPDFGEAVVAVIVPGTEGGGDLAESAVIAHARRHLASFKAPKAVLFVDELPRNSMGKVEKNNLRRRFADVFQGAVTA